MNALVKKEIHLLLPSFLIGVALVFANCFFGEDPSEFDTLSNFISFIFCPAIAIFMALNSFGAEISAGTFSMLLAQPIERIRIWRTKTSLLAVALFIGGFLWCVILYLRFKPFAQLHSEAFGNLPDLFVGVWLFLLAVYSGALWTVLLLRQVAAAFWFTLLVPGAILVAVIGLLGDKHPDHPEWVQHEALGALLIYSVAGFIFARWLFLRAQDVAWTGGTIALPEMRGYSKSFTRATEKRSWRPKAALFWKELQLHQAQFILAGALALLHLGVIATRKFGHYQKNSDMEFVLEIFWGLWLVMPMLVGAAAVAEERKLGTLGSQFCLPVKRRTQFAIKFRVAMLLSVLFGVVMPLLLEGSRILPDVHSNSNPIMAIADLKAGYYGWQLQMSTAQTFFWNCFYQLDPLLPLLTLMGIATAIGAVSFYASTLARNTLQALAPAVLGLVLTFFLNLMLVEPGNFGLHLPWRGWLIYFIGVPVLLITLVALSFGNFKRVNLSGKVWLQNAFAFAAALAFVIVTTAAVYHRAWEKLTPFEPSHGVARLSLSNPATLSEQLNTFSVRLPGGRIWTDDYILNADVPNPLALLLGDASLTSLSGGHFYDGSNWVSVTRNNWNEKVGIKNDGTLWVSESPQRAVRSKNAGWKIIEAGNMVQFDSETNWNSAIPQFPFMLLVKNDGTLWRWGNTNAPKKYNEWPGLKSFTPHRLGTESNWAEVFLADDQFFLRKTDGSVWTTWIYKENTSETIELEPGLSIQRTSFEHGKWRGTTRVGNSLNSNLGIRDDGTFRLWSDLKLNQTAHTNQYTLERTVVDLQFGKDTNWLGVAGRGETIVTLKNDGSLWLWDFYRDNRRDTATERAEREMLDVKPVRLGTHADWIAITSAEGGIISLAVDGSLWYWPLERPDKDDGRYVNGNDYGPRFEPLLDFSRKPQLLGNVFESSGGNRRPATTAAELSLTANLAVGKAPTMPIPANAPVNVTLLSTSNAPDGSRVAWYCLTNHTAKGVVFLADSNSLPLYSLNEYLAMESYNSIRVTNHNLVNFFSSRPAPLPAHTAKIFRVEIPAGVTNAVLYLNYLRQKSDREEKNEALLNDFRAWIGLGTPDRRSESYINYPLSLP